MKKLITVCLLLCCGIAKAQIAGYTFSKSTATYANLPATKTEFNSAWTDPFISLVMTMPIDIELFGQEVDQDVRPTYRGQLLFRGFFTGDDFTVSALGAELAGVVNGNIGEVSYVVDGNAPNRIFKMEYNRVGFFTESPKLSYVNFQIWLYETSNIIEFRYGPNSIQGAGAWPEDFGLFHEAGSTSTTSIEVLGNPAAPTVSAGTLMDGTHLNGFPAPNTVYKFVRTGTAVSEIGKMDDLVASYDIEKNQIVVSGKDIKLAKCEIYSLAGQRLFEKLIENNRLYIPASGLVPGLYIVKVATENGISSKKIVIN
jgi:hypothetical protein